ncbi:MAG: CGNR zinc finger domain-containing protein [Streptosporangiales bacterium]|nr:CGNR zinc finger domain-containing protein [Streptosporangiales bacterium]
MDFNSHTDAVIAMTVRLVNVVTPGTARGRTYEAPGGEALSVAVTEALTHRARPELPRDVYGPTDTAGLAAVAHRFRSVFAAVDAGDVDSAATVVNELLAESGAHPQLSRHDGEPWHLHYHGDDGRLVSSWTAGCATGLAVVLGGEHADRLGVCKAPACDRVYVDTSRNGTRRFCSTTCQSRVKAAAYRERRLNPSR